MLHYFDSAVGAIQELNHKVEKQRDDLEHKEGEITELKQRLEKLERLMNRKLDSLPAPEAKQIK